MKTCTRFKVSGDTITDFVDWSFVDDEHEFGIVQEPHGERYLHVEGSVQVKYVE